MKKLVFTIALALAFTACETIYSPAINDKYIYRGPYQIEITFQNGDKKTLDVMGFSFEKNSKTFFIRTLEDNKKVPIEGVRYIEIKKCESTLYRNH